MDGRKSARVDSLSKLTTIEQLRERLVEEFGAEPERQRLFYRGKQVSSRGIRTLEGEGYVFRSVGSPCSPCG